MDYPRALDSSPEDRGLGVRDWERERVGRESSLHSIRPTFYFVYSVLCAESFGRITVVRIERNVQLITSRVDHRGHKRTTISIRSTS